MKIALISQPWNPMEPPVTAGSIAIWTYHVARHLAQSCEVTIYAQRTRKGLKEQTVDQVHYRYVSIAFDRSLIRGMKILRHRIFDRLPGASQKKRYYFAKWYYYLGYILGVAKDVQKRNYDVVHVLNLSQFVPVLRRADPRIKIVLHMHCEWLTQLNPNTVAPRLKHTDSIIGVTEFITQKIRQTYPEVADRCVTCFNGVDIERFRPVEPDNGGLKNKKKLRLLYVGRISPEKGIHVLVRAFKKIAAVHKNVELVIAGPRVSPPVDYVYRITQDQLTKDLMSFAGSDYLNFLKQEIPPNLQHHVSFPGAIPHTQLHDYYRSADIFIFPSVWEEPFGIPVIEALACGVPVVTTQSGGIPELVENGVTGFVVPRNDAQALATVLLRLIENTELRKRMGEAARRHAEANFSYKVIAQRILNHYKQIANQTEKATAQPIEHR